MKWYAMGFAKRKYFNSLAVSKYKNTPCVGGTNMKDLDYMTLNLLIFRKIRGLA